MQIDKIASAFRIDGTPVRWNEFGNGHINRTVKVYTDTGREYVLQRINKYVFKNPVWVMKNAVAVTTYLQERVDDPRMVLHFIPATTGKYYHKDEEGEFWRMTDFVGGFSLDLPESDEDFYQSALAFGRFQEMLAGYPADSLFEIIPNFHNTIDRYEKFKESVRIDGVARVEEVEEDISFLLEREALGGTLQKMLDAGILPLRVTHNDTKLNNVLLDKATRKSLCVLDLDTVMPGLSLYDFGDSIRFGAATATEDEKDVSKMKLDLHLFQVYTRGFLEAAPSLTAMEVALLPLGAIIMTLEVANRFLKDYLDGDLYFKVRSPEHNLIRARAQMRLLEDIEAKELYLLEENDTIVAIYTINQKWDGEYDKCTWHNKSKTACVIHRLCVLPAFQNKGIGKAVLNHIENQAKEMEYESVRLDVFSKNPYAIRLYENNSYEKRGNVCWRKGEFYLMEKKI